MPETAYRNRVAIALKAAVAYRGMSTKDLAKAVGVDVETIRRWMRRERGLSAEDAAKLAVALNAPGDLFLRPPETRERAMAMMTAWEAAAGAGQ